MINKISLLGVHLDEPCYILTSNQFKHLSNKITLLLKEKKALQREVKDLKTELEEIEKQRDHYSDMYATEIGLDI